MADLPSSLTTLWWLRLLLLGCLALVMTDAALDKATGWSGNAEYVKKVFGSSRLRPLAVPLLAVLAVLMGSAALGCLGGIVQLLLGVPPSLGWLGALLSCLTFLALLFGLQIGRDHDSAKGVVVYFLISVLGLWAVGMAG